MRLDEKWLGHRHRRPEKFLTIPSELETGEPVWIGSGRDSDTVASWLATLSREQKAAIALFACDMHAPFVKAVRGDPALAHAAIVHDPFHIMKRAGQAISELGREIFLRWFRDACRRPQHPMARASALAPSQGRRPGWNGRVQIPFCIRQPGVIADVLHRAFEPGLAAPRA